MNIYGPNELLEDVQRAGLCVGCGACVDMCPYFATWRGKTSQIFPCTSQKGRCNAHCPKTEVDLDALSDAVFGRPYGDGALGHYRQILTAKAGKNAPKVPYQTGGTVTALLAWAMENGHAAGAVVTGRDGLVPEPRLAKTVDEVCACSGSKYMASPTVAAVNRAMRDGLTRLAVAGTPCQMTALAQMRQNPLAREGFADPVAFSVGLFCTWALDTRGLMGLLAGKVNPEDIAKMDVPPPPAEVFVITLRDGSVHKIPLAEIRAFIPDGCSLCPDLSAEWADVSVGQVEGMPGYNTLIARTETGLGMVEGAVRDGWLETGEMPPLFLEGLVKAAGNKKRRALALAAARELLNTGEGKRSVLRLSAETAKAFLGA
jgi:coenzyme F420 hydrogenase subunit beta